MADAFHVEERRPVGCPAPWRNHASDALGVFTYSGDHQARWADVAELWIEGYWCFDWASETIRVKSLDPSTRQITMGAQHVYGIGSGNPALADKEEVFLSRVQFTF